MITLHYLETRDLGASVLFATEDQKAKAVNKLGITITDGDTPLDAWLKVVHAENGLEYSKPAHQDIAYAILESPGARAFMWLLA